MPSAGNSAKAAWRERDVPWRVGTSSVQRIWNMQFHIIEYGISPLPCHLRQPTAFTWASFSLESRKLCLFFTSQCKTWGNVPSSCVRGSMEAGHRPLFSLWFERQLEKGLDSLIFRRLGSLL